MLKEEEFELSLGIGKRPFRTNGTMQIRKQENTRTKYIREVGAWAEVWALKRKSGTQCGYNSN